jgi:hypothetical protein
MDIPNSAQAQWDITSLQAQVKALQEQVKTLLDQITTLQKQGKTDQAAVNTLQTSLQNLQAQFANHAHKVDHTIAGHWCAAIQTFQLTTGSGQNMQVPLEYGQACPGHPEWNGYTPNCVETLHVSTPVQGAQ